ncbi:MAG: AraC family transcriptional regulator, partial [Gammaproteobacteria bacterium]
EQGHALSVLASQCGFSSQSHMNRLFKKWKGVTPGQYQRLVNS